MSQDLTTKLEAAPDDCAFKRCIRWEDKMYAVSNTDHETLFPGRIVGAKISGAGIAIILGPVREDEGEDEETTKAFVEAQWKYQQAELRIHKLREFIKNNIIIESHPVPDRWKCIKDAAWAVLGEQQQPFIMRVLKILQSWGMAAKMGDVSKKTICILDFEITKREDGSWAMFKGDCEITLSCADEDKITDVYLAGLILDTIRKETEQHRPSNSEDLGQH
jgi:hypothetical protein